MHYTIDKNILRNLASRIISNNTALFAPVNQDNITAFKKLESDKELNIDFNFVNTKLPLKELFFPRTEKVLDFKYNKNEAVTKDIENFAPKRVILGARLCDAHSIHILKSVFEWDFKDKFFLKRIENTVVISLGCNKLDKNCLCTTFIKKENMFLGSDIVLFENNDKFLVKVISKNGEEFIKEYNEFFKENTSVESKINETINSFYENNKPKIDVTAITSWLKNNFDNNLFLSESLKCIGCGTCSYLCPTCHCFDIVDEGGYKKGERRKNWDCCAFSMFTKHASGHNPRPSRKERWRQRIMHKFSYYDEKFGKIACVGCGRCISYCPAGMSMIEMFEKMKSGK